MVKAIDRKLLRDLGHLKGQIVTVALVVAAGLSGLVGLYSTLYSLQTSMQDYYERTRFGEVFVRLVRAPTVLQDRIEGIEGVQSVYTRVVEPVTVPMPQMLEPATGQIVSVPEDRQPPMNGLAITRGRYIEPGGLDEVIVLDSFAEAHGLEPGDSLEVVMGGGLRRLHVVGFAMSPEFVFVGRPGEFFPDDRTVTVLWMAEEVVEAAFQMSGAFNDVVLQLQPDAREAAVIAELDTMLEGYGGLGAHGRSDHSSNSLVEDELAQLQILGMTIPIGFLAIAAFLLNIVLSRLVQLQRPEIATLKAVGYGQRQIAGHFFKFVLVILVLGTVLGIVFGAFIGQGMAAQYTDFFRFPDFVFQVDMRAVVAGVIVSLIAGLAGAFVALYRVARLPPAEAMQPRAPAVYRRTVIERIGLYPLLSGSMRMIVRELERKPLRFVFS
ncbi:MAG: ABC transporter permease, partial [Bradymonadaceae bacterium]